MNDAMGTVREVAQQQAWLVVQDHKKRNKTVEPGTAFDLEIYIQHTIKAAVECRRKHRRALAAADAAPAPAAAAAANEDATAGADEKPLGENSSAPKRGFVPKGDGKRVQVCCVAVAVPLPLLEHSCQYCCSVIHTVIIFASTTPSHHHHLSTSSTPVCATRSTRQLISRDSGASALMGAKRNPNRRSLCTIPAYSARSVRSSPPST